jgi:predicted DsbA family dithiol-disulfide isomerase
MSISLHEMACAGKQMARKGSWSADVGQSMQVEIWSDVVCPWCYLGKRRFERAVAGFDHADTVEVTYRSFELDPTAPPGETTPTRERLAGRYGMSAEQIDRAQRQMEHRAAMDGLDLHLGDLRSGNTRDAHRLLHLAREAGDEAELVERLHRAYFCEQRSVFDRESLAAVALEAGLSPTAVDDVLTSGRFTDEVLADEALAAAFGATGVPFFVIDRTYAISGAQSEEILRGALDRAWLQAAAS